MNVWHFECKELFVRICIVLHIVKKNKFSLLERERKKARRFSRQEISNYKISRLS